MPNRLADATSPYLLQHSENPVEWLPWGEEAFELARQRDLPVLLSIGYAACHWCHVMAHESFEDERVAAFMNERFVCVKVDREERPDVDAVYMNAVQAMTGAGGWPLTVVVTPDGAPFFGGTYFPPQPRWGQPSFRQVLEGISRAWRERREEVEEAARGLHEQLRALEAPLSPSSGAPAGTVAAPTDPEAAAGQALRALAATFDAERGGFGGAPKFPPHGALRFLLARPEEHALAMATATLDAMADGGIHDQLGGGFARYSVDARWDVPHFEKMLYDNAQLLQLYAEGYRRTGRARFAAVAEGIVSWLARELRSPEGALYSSLDADSEGEEGRFYTWTEEEVEAACGADAAVALRHFGVRTPGPFEGRNVLRVAEPLPAAAAALKLDPEEAGTRLERARRALAAARERRPRPSLDDKALASWNGLALVGLADAARLLGSERALGMARDVVRFVRAHLLAGRTPAARLARWHRARRGAAGGLRLPGAGPAGAPPHHPGRAPARAGARPRRRRAQRLRGGGRRLLLDLASRRASAGAPALAGRRRRPVRQRRRRRAAGAPGPPDGGRCVGGGGRARRQAPGGRHAAASPGVRIGPDGPPHPGRAAARGGAGGRPACRRHRRAGGRLAPAGGPCGGGAAGERAGRCAGAALPAGAGS